ncbi:MAG: glycosyltransferase, partial [Candidatus Nanohaloarchaea archaeon]
VEELNEFFDTDLEENDFTVRKPVLSSQVFSRTGKMFKLRNALIKRYARRSHEDYDLLVSGLNEADFGGKGLQYVHFPDSVNEQLFHETGEVSTDLTATADSVVYQAYLETVERFFTQEKEGIEKNVTVCNSEFTRNVYEQVFDNEAKVVNPPVSMEFEKRPGFEDRENGFVCVSKLSPPKEQKKVIRIIDRVREEHEVHLHLVGSDPGTRYAEEVREMVDDRDYVRYEGELPRKDLADIISSHRYGIHGFSGEHYGLAPAEMVKGGCVTFVPGRGGQKDIVDREELVYGGEDEAVRKISKVLEDTDLRENIREDLGSREFNTPEDFRQKIQEIVEEGLK